MKEIRWGIIGCGDVAERKSGPAFQLAPGSKLVAVMRRNTEKAADFATRHQVPKWYDNAGALLNDPDVNAVYIATPPASHEAYAIAALEAGKNVYLEKPMAMDAAGAARIQAKAEKSSGKLVVAHYRRAQETFLKIKEMLTNGSIGTPVLADVRLLQPLQSNLIADSETNWRVNPALSGGGLFHDLAPHQLDLMLYFFGPAAQATGYSRNTSGAYAAADTVSGIIEFQSGVSFRGLWYFAAPAAEAQDSCEIIGTAGKLSFPVFGQGITVWREGEKESLSFQAPRYVQQPMIEQVVRYFQGDGPNPCPAQEAVAVMQMLDAFTGKVGLN